MGDSCSTCGRSEPTIHTKITISSTEFAKAINEAIARGRAVRASLPRVRRFSWWRFTLLVR